MPTRYTIRLEPDLKTSAFRGKETVEVTVREPVSEIILNAAELRIQEVTIHNGRGTTLRGMARLDEVTERARLLFPETLSPGPWRLSLSFVGILNDRLEGFYRIPVKTAQPDLASGRRRDGEETGLAVTFFEPTHARRAFPCWDEPAFKAIFEVTLVIDQGLTALSNAAAVSERIVPRTRKKVVSFSPTIKMPTYVVAFVVGELEATEPAKVDSTLLRIWGLPGKKRLATFAQEIATFSLRFYEDYYGMPYPGDKLDLIALPELAASAMENLGAITFRERALLVDERTAAHWELEAVANSVAHEIAHMWFGDLVTMTWWNGLWLNEAFATFLAMLAVDAWKPEWERWVSFGAYRAAALEVDGLWASRPIEFEVTAPKDAEAMFNVLTYRKGAAMLRMIEQYLGPNVFRAGLRQYLAEYQLQNTETTDLWRALGEVSHEPIATIMDGWIFRPGYPLVTVRTQGEGKVLLFSQHRFTYLPDGGSKPDAWQIPINVRVQVDGEVRHMQLLLSSEERRIELPGRLDWVVVNEGGHGFYQVRYDQTLREKLVVRPEDTMAAVERFNLVNDTWACALAGLCSVAEYLDLTEHFRQETDRNVWTALIGSFAYLDRIVVLPDRSGLEGLVRDRLGPAVARLGWSPVPGERELTSQLRGALLRAMGTLGNDSATQSKARELYALYRDDPSRADPNVLRAFIAIVAHSGGEAEYADFLEKFRMAKTPQEQHRYLYALAGFRDPKLLRQTLRRTMTGEVRIQDAPSLMRRLLMSVDARELAWEFVKKHWDRMADQYPLNGLRRMCNGIPGLATPELEADVRAFIASRGITLGGKTLELEQYMEQLRVAVAFRDRERARLRDYLSRFVVTR